MNDSGAATIVIITILFFVGGLLIYPIIRAWRNGHKGWAIALILFAPTGLSFALSIITLTLKKDHKWPFEKDFTNLQEASVGYRAPKEYTYADRIAARIAQGMIFIPWSQPYRFPEECVYCLQPSVTTKDLSKQTTQIKDRTFVDRTVVRETIVRTIGGIPYCRDCYARGVEVSIWIRRVNWGVLIVSALFILIWSIVMGGQKGFTQAIVIGIFGGGLLFFLLRFVLGLLFGDLTIFTWGEAGKGLLGIRGQLSEENKTGGNAALIYGERQPGVFLTFKNKEYARKFMDINQFKIFEQ
jgi:hypothetical protein